MRSLSQSLLSLSVPALVCLSLVGCALPHGAVSHVIVPAPTAPADVDWDAQGPITADVRVSATAEVPRSGLIDLDDPRAAGLADEPAPIELLVTVLHHPTAGALIVDTGIDQDLADGGPGAMRAPLRWVFRGAVAAVASLDGILGGSAPDRVLLTHLHSDHVLGLPDVPAEVPVWFGPGELDGRALMHAIDGRTIGAALDGHALAELSLDDAVDVPVGPDTLRGWDLLGDGSLWALHAPGHTAGALAFVARTVDGPLLLTGDVSHTRWGWEHDVPPGTFTEAPEAGARSFAILRAFAAEHPGMRVVFGHER